MRLIAAVPTVLLTVATAYCGEPKPLWEIDTTTASKPSPLPAQAVTNYAIPSYSYPSYGGVPTPSVPDKSPKAAATNVCPGWVSYSPDGQFLATVTVGETRGPVPEFTYQLRVWSGPDRVERFSASLGASRSPHMGDELASFPTNDSILTGGTDISIRNLGNGQILSSQQTGGLPAHTVWAVPDLRESFYLCREKLRFDEPAELSIQSGDLIRDQFQFQQFPGRRFRYQDTMTEQTGLRPTREGLRTESVAMNFARTQLAAAFHDDPALAAPKHSLVLYQVKTTEEFELVPVGEAVSAPGGRVSALGFARNGKTLASGGDDGTVCLWDVGDEIGPWKPRVTIEPVGNSRVSAVAFTRDWRMVAAVTWDKTKPNLLLIDADAGKLLASVHLTGMLNSVTFSPDCKTVLTGSADGKIRAWDIAELLKGETATGQAKQIPVK